MTRDKVEGFLIGIGAGVLLGAFMEFRDQQARATPGEEKAVPEQSRPESGPVVEPQDLRAQAARA